SQPDCGPRGAGGQSRQRAGLSVGTAGRHQAARREHSRDRGRAARRAGFHECSPGCEPAADGAAAWPGAAAAGRAAENGRRFDWFGRTTSEMWRYHELPVDIEREHPKMGPLVAAAAEKGAAILEHKRRAAEGTVPLAASPLDQNAAWYDSPFMKACRREPTDV